MKTKLTEITLYKKRMTEDKQIAPNSLFHKIQFKVTFPPDPVKYGFKMNINEVETIEISSKIKKN